MVYAAIMYVPRTTLITDRDDPRIAPYVSVREHDLVRRDGLFVAEGDVVVRVLVASRTYAIQSVLVSESRVEALGRVIADIDPAVPIYAVEHGLMQAIIGFPIHRGLMAIGVRGADSRGDVVLDRLGSARATVVALVGVCNHDNVGGIFRNAAAFGASAVLLDATCCDPLYRKALRVSVGGVLHVPFARYDSAHAMLDALTQRGFELVALSPHGEHRLETLGPAPRRAIILGAEGPGLPADVMARARRTRIDIASHFDSLNVAVTSGIALHALANLARESGATG